MPIVWRGCNVYKAPEEVDPKALETFRSDRCIGSESFRKSCLEQIEDKVGENHSGITRLETASAKAERLITQELVRLHWTGEDLMARPNSNPSKLALASRLRRETILSKRSRGGSIWENARAQKATCTDG
jgi:hypothetical protein